MNKLIIFKWASLLLSVGCISFFIVSDVYGDNNVNIEEVPQEEIQEEAVEELITEIDELEHAAEESGTVTLGCNAYEAQIASDNGKVSETIIEKYEACTVTKTVETTAPVETAPVISEKKVKETKLVKEKKK